MRCALPQGSSFDLTVKGFFKYFARKGAGTMISFTDNALKHLDGLAANIPSACLRVSPAGAV